MPALSALKEELLALCRKTDGGFKTSNAPWLDRIRELMGELAAINPLPAPMLSEEIDGRWKAEFASFGIKPQEGQGIRRESDLMFNSFGKLPSAAINVTDIYQDIDRDSGAYNNLIEFDIPGSDIRGELITVGRFRPDDENPLRAVVEFFEVVTRPRDSAVSEAEFRAALGVDASVPLQAEFRPPRLHSDIVFLDNDLRVNIGSVGGNYVLSQTGQPAGTAAMSVQ